MAEYTSTTQAVYVDTGTQWEFVERRVGSVTINDGDADNTFESGDVIGGMNYQGTLDINGDICIVFYGPLPDSQLDPSPYPNGSTGYLVYAPSPNGGSFDFPLTLNTGSIQSDPITVCFMPGTMISTPDGEAAIETLRVGDMVLTADGHTLPVRWLARQTVSALFASPLHTLPIRIAAGALAENQPSRDLLVSPGHALLVDGALIQAGALVNGTTIRRENGVPAVFTYYHVELNDHSLILAEGVPAETFVDNVERMAFDNWGEHLALYPDGCNVPELPHPRAKSHRQVPAAIRARLAARAAELMQSTAAAA